MVTKTQLAIAGLLTFILAGIGHPLWLATLSSYSYLCWLYWGLGIGFIGVGATLALMNRYEILQALFGVWGWTWFILFFFQCFPSFSISL